MADQSPNGVEVPPRGQGAKKELSNEQLKSYIHKARAKIRKLEDENKSLVTKVDEARTLCAARDADLVTSLEEVNMWKGNCQHQMNAKSSNDGVSEELAQAMRGEEEAQAEASRWKEKAVASEELEARMLSLEDDFEQTKISSERAEKAMMAAHQKELAQSRNAVENLRRQVTANEDVMTRHTEIVEQAAKEAELAQQASTDLQTQVEALLRDAGALEHRLVNTQQERDQALSHSSDLEAELQRLRADAQDAAGAAARTELLAAERLAAEQEAREERDLAVTRSSELEEEVQRLQAADAQEDKMAADDENVAAERLAAAAETLASEHKEALLERQQQLDRALAEALDLRREVDELRAVREESEGERNSETERLASKHNDSLQERQQELDRALVEAAELRSEAVDLRAGREELEGERNAETERARDEVVVALDEARAEVGVLKERGVEMAEELVTVTREREDGAAVAAGLKEAVDGVRSDLVHVERARDEAVKDKEEAEARAAATVEAAGEKVARDSAVLRQELESERAALIASLSEVEAAKVAAEQDAGTLRTRTAKLEETVAELQEKLAEASAEARDPDEHATGGATVENAAEAVEPLDTSVTVPPDETALAVGDESSRDADLLARCEELEREATAAAEKIAGLETRLSESASAASATAAASEAAGRHEAQDVASAAAIAEPDVQEGARLKSKAMPGLGEAGGEVGRGEVSPNEEVMGEAGGVHKELEEPMVQEQQRLLETRLREAKAMAEDSKGAMKEMEGVIAGLRGEEAALNTRLLELSAEVASAKEATSLAQEGLEAEKEEMSLVAARADAAEALVRELEEKEEAAARDAGDAARSMGERADAAEALLRELEEKGEAEKEEVRLVSERADDAEARVKELEEEAEAAATDAGEAARSMSERADAAEALTRGLEERGEAEKEEVCLVSERADIAEARVRELEEKAEAASKDAGETARSMSERADAAEALKGELEEEREAARGAEDAAQTLRAEKVALESRLNEAMEEVARVEQALAESVSCSMSAAETAERELSELEEQKLALKEKIMKAVARLRSLKEENETATTELASKSTLLETSQKDLADVQVRCRSFEEAAVAVKQDATERASVGGERLSALVEEASQLRQELAGATQSAQEAEDRARGASEQATRFRAELEERCERLEELQEAVRVAQESAGRVPALETDLGAERAARNELEGEVKALKEGVRERDVVREDSARESEAIVGALQGQVDAANKERDAAAAGLEAAEKDRDSNKARLRDLVVKYKSVQAKWKAAQEESASFKTEADKITALQEKAAELQTQVGELESKLAVADAALKDREDDFAKTIADKDEAIAVAASGKEETDGKVKRLKSLLSKLQKASHNKDADIATLKAGVRPPKAFTVDLRVRCSGNVWCLVQPVPLAQTTAGEEGVPGTEEKKEWVLEDKARVWIAGGSSASDLTHWPTVIQDSFDERMAAAAAEFKVAAADAVSARAEIETLTNDFNKYKARAHTALKKATSSGADDKRKDEIIADLEAGRNRLVAELERTMAKLEGQLSDARAATKAREDELEDASGQLETAQEEVRELQGSLRDQERKVAQLQEVEDGHSEELSALREAMDELRLQLKTAKSQANEASCIAQRLQEELESVAKEREAAEGRGGEAWDSRSDGGWAGDQILATSHGQTTGESPHGFSHPNNLSDDFVPPPVVDSAGGEGCDDGESLMTGGRGGAGRSMKLMAVAELERRHTNVESHVQAEVSEMRTELAEALLRVEQLSEQEAVLKAAVRSLETELKTERNLGSGETAPVNVAYLKSAVVRYMSTRDAGEQRSLLRVISTMLQLTKDEVAAVEARIAELERTMVGRAGSMVGGAGRRVGGVVGGVVGLVWRGGGKDATPAQAQGEYGPDESNVTVDGDGTIY